MTSTETPRQRDRNLANEELSVSDTITQIKRMSGEHSYSDSYEIEYGFEECEKALENVGIGIHLPYFEETTQFITSVEKFKQRFFNLEEKKSLDEAEIKISEDPNNIEALMNAGNILKSFSKRLIDECKEEDVC